MADATQVQRRRGTASQCAAMTPAEGELIVNLTDDRVHLGDGLVAGGIVLPNARDLVRQSFTYGIAGGTANALTLNIPQLFAYAEGVMFEFRATAANTGAVTIDVNTLGVRNIYKNNGLGIIPLVAGDLVSGGIYRVSYDGAQFQLTNAAQQPLVNSGLVLIDTLSGSGVNELLFNSIGGYNRHKLIFRGTRPTGSTGNFRVYVGSTVLISEAVGGGASFAGSIDISKGNARTYGAGEFAINAVASISNTVFDITYTSIKIDVNTGNYNNIEATLYGYAT